MKAKEYKRFNRAQRGSGIYTCAECGKRTRDTGQGEGSVCLCKKCYLEAGLCNEHADGGHLTPVEGCPLCAEPGEQISYV